MIEGATVFVVDDDKASRESVRSLVETMGVKAQLFSSAEEFLDAYDTSQPGCLVTDVCMLGMSGVALQEKLNSSGVRIPTIVISAYADVPLAVRAMQQGAVTLLEKPCRGMELWDAIRQALEDDAKGREEEHRRRELAERLDTLTEKEQRILGLIVSGMANKVIARRLDMGLRTVETRRASIFRKMQAGNVAELGQLVGEARGGARPG